MTASWFKPYSVITETAASIDVAGGTAIGSAVIHSRTRASLGCTRLAQPQTVPLPATTLKLGDHGSAVKQLLRTTRGRTRRQRRLEPSARRTRNRRRANRRHPTDTTPVALHSNPGPEHTFVDPDSGSFTGLIDFGDAYRSHPALDLRPWPDEQDAQHLLAGYRSLGPLPNGFEQVWRTGLVIMALARTARGVRGTEETLAAVERHLEHD
jgi:aminoglycoside phosphotransferase (APT) family kinase protein